MIWNLNNDICLSIFLTSRVVLQVPDIIRDGCKSLNSLKKRTNCQSPEKNRFVLISFQFKSDSLMLKSKSLINDQFNRLVDLIWVSIS